MLTLSATILEILTAGWPTLTVWMDQEQMWICQFIGNRDGWPWPLEWAKDKRIKYANLLVTVMFAISVTICELLSVKMCMSLTGSPWHLEWAKVKWKNANQKTTCDFVSLAIAMFVLSVTVCKIQMNFPMYLIQMFNLENEGQGHLRFGLKWPAKVPRPCICMHKNWCF